MHPPDAKQIYSLGHSVEEFRATPNNSNAFWPLETLEEIAEKEIAYVVENNQEIVGFLIATYQSTTRKITWENMYIKPAYQKRGLAEYCFQKTWEMARKEGAIIAEALVASNNLSAQKMCKGLGFNSAGDYQWMLKWK